MALYYFVIRHGEHTSHESDGIELPDLEAAQVEAIMTTGEMLRELRGGFRLGSEWRMEVADAAQKPVYVLRVTAEVHE
jgi:hypothetical protein